LGQISRAYGSTPCQRYSRLAKKTYRYESETGFSAEIVVNDLGLVTEYPGGWERIAAL